MPVWNFAAVWGGLASIVPDREAIVCGERRVTWGDFADRARRLSWYLARDARLEPGDKVAIDLTNRPEYLETFFAALLLGCVPVNVNFRYVADEVHHVLDDSDAKFVVHGPEQAKAVARAAKRIQRPWRPRLLEVGEPYERALAGASPPEVAPRAPSGDDLIFLYTGGTTGMPKGVMWRNEDLYVGLWAVSHPDRPDPSDPLEAARAGKRTGIMLPVAPLMHGTGLNVALATLAGGGTVVLIDQPGLDAELVWDTVEREHVEMLTLVGDVFARPLLAALDSHPGRWDISGLRGITSSGVLFSPDTKRALLAHLSGLTIIDTLGASEGLGPSNTSRAGDATNEPARFRISERVHVFDEHTGRDVTPGSDEIGLVAMGGHLPIGYYNDPARTAATFRVIGGERYSIPGDYATVDVDGTVRLLGRGSASINTGGEKVYPEEVELVLRKHASVFDCVVLGVPDPRFGEKVVALIQVTEGHYLDEAELAAWGRTKLAGYKAPRRFLFVDTIERSAAGKAPHQKLRALAIAHLSVAPTA
ncbi:MAG: AMP-binding protein [Acidimicrobiia bacterium]